MRDFFISYNQEDRAWAEWIAWHLEAVGYTTVLQDWDFRPGANFVLEIQKAATEARRTIAVLSPAYLKSLYTPSEWAAAFAQDPTGERGVLLPVRVQECEITGLWLQIIYIDLVGLDEFVAKESLLKGVMQGRSKPAVPPKYPKTVQCTKPGQPQFPGALPPIWNVPHLRNPNFTGRDDLLSEVSKTLTSGQNAVLTAMVGLGGVGKTQLAVEYAYRQVTNYTLVWWIRSEEKATLATDYASLAAELKLPESETKESGEIISAVRRHLQYVRDWLLIFDNAQQPEDIEDYLPRGTAGHVLVTSRNPNWGSVAKPLKVTVMEQDESVAFLLKRTGQSYEVAVDQLAEELGHLPLALAQAAAYIEQTGKSLASYLQLLRAEQWEMLRRGTPSVQDRATVATTWEISFRQMRQLSPAAADMMNLMAYLAPDQLPLSLLKMGTEHLPQSVAAAVWQPVRLDEAVAALRRYSLIEMREELISVHRLVQTVVRSQLGEKEKLQWAGAAVRLVGKAFSGKSTEIGIRAERARLLSHALVSTEHAEALGVDGEATARLLAYVGTYLEENAQYTEAKAAHARALKICKEIYRADHPHVAVCINNIGIVLLAIGDFEGAREHFERALGISEKTFAPDHPTIATRLNNLGAALYGLGDFEGARDHFERALRIREETLGHNHPDVANTLGNLAAVISELGDLRGARARHEMALEIDEGVYGFNHPTISRHLENLGNMLSKLGDFEGARDHLERALRIREDTLGRNHPDVASSLSSLGGLLITLGDYEGARARLEQALKINEQVYGHNHPDVADCLLSLGNTLKHLNDFEGARPYLERALKISEQVYGPDHPKIAEALNCLGVLLSDLDDFDGARAHLERALRIREETVGPDHPGVIVDLNNLGLSLVDLGDYEGARAHLERGLKISEQVYGCDHPDVASSLSSLGSLLIDLGEYDLASAYLERALRIFLDTLGENHFRTSVVKDDLERIRRLRKPRRNRAKKVRQAGSRDER